MSWGETIFLKKIIDGKKTFRASDFELVHYIDEQTTLSQAGKTLGTFTAKTIGQIKLKAVVHASSAANTKKGIAVYDGSTEIVTIPVYSINTSPTEKSAIFSVAKNKTYTLKVTDGMDPSACDSLIICADIVDGSTFGYTVD